MEKTSISQPHKTPLGDSTVDGLFAGIVAGILMAIVMIVLGILRGTGPGETMMRFSLDGPVSPFIGTMMHLATSGVYGALFGVALYYLNRGWTSRLLVWILGIAYAAILYLIAEAVLVNRLAASFAEFPLSDLISAHLIYGLCLGWITYRQHR